MVETAPARIETTLGAISVHQRGGSRLLDNLLASLYLSPGKS
jgi:hypothetical protein